MSIAKHVNGPEEHARDKSFARSFTCRTIVAQVKGPHERDEASN